jgi:hypothetical protein
LTASHAAGASTWRRGALDAGAIARAFADAGLTRAASTAASRRAAERFGFTFEGVFRKHQIVKGRNRDTAWYAITDDEWPAIDSGYQAWLAPESFDGHGRQRRSLRELINDARRVG